MTAVLTDLAALKAWMDAGSSASLSTDQDAVLQAMIDATEAAFEQHMRRPVLDTSRAWVVKRVRRFQRRITLPAAPVSAVASVEYDAAGDFTSPDTVPATDYYLEEDEGVLTMRDDAVWSEGVGVYRVTYTGGMGADVAAVLAAFPDVVHAAHMQIAYEWQRKRSPGSTTSTGRGGTKTFEGALTMLPRVKAVLDKHRRLRV